MIVADYFAMLHDDISGSPYSKAGHNRQLQSLIGRGRGCIEFKHRNISAVLKGLGETWIEGYKGNRCLGVQGECPNLIERNTL